MDSSAHKSFRLTPADAYPGPSRLSYVIIGALLGLLAFIIVVFYVLFSPLQVVGESMLPTLHDGDRALRTHDYKVAVRGDIVVVDTLQRGRLERVVKRVIAVPGDTVEVVDDVAIVNGRPETGEYRLLDVGNGVNAKPTIVPPDSVYVMGDNRPISLDSRFVGPLPMNDVEGKVVIVYLPFKRAGVVR